jgi:UDP-N-acetyl-D-mannosaminuronate dehydrogenase
LYTNDELDALGLESFTLGNSCDAVVIQADHAEFRGLTTADFPAAKFLVDGRNISSPALRLAIPTYVVGIGA